MLKHYDDTTGTFSWHCNTQPDCPNHSCRDAYGECALHDYLPKAQRPLGNPITADHTHPQVQWVDTDLVALPPCPLCGSQMFLKVAFTAKELAAANINVVEQAWQDVDVPDAANPGHTIKQRQLVTIRQYQHPAIAMHTALAAKMKANGKQPPTKAGK